MRSHNYCSKKANPKNYIHRAIKKYGKTQFDIEVLDEADNFEDLNNKEVDWIYILNTIDYGYNLTAGGEGCSVKIGRRHPPEVIAIIVSKNKGQKRTKEQKEMISRVAKERVAKYGWTINWNGKKHTDESKAKMSAKRKGKKWYYNPATNESRQLFDNSIPDGWIPGRYIPKEDREKMTAARKYDSKVRENMSKGKANKKICHNLITKQNKFFYPDDIPEGWVLGWF